MAGMPGPSLIWIDDDQALPPTRLAWGEGSAAPGLLAAGAPVTADRLREAYRLGVFPWYSPGEPPLWWSPDPRMVLPVADFKVSRSLRKTLRQFARQPGARIEFDRSFETVMRACAGAPRDGQAGTWITDDILAAYSRWHNDGDAAGCPHSVETWLGDELVGGLYGVNIGRMFFGESMFARRTDASKIALAALVAFCRAQGITLIDCQQNTRHLASLGAREITRAAFEAHLSRTLGSPPPLAWNYDPALWALLDLDAAPERPTTPESPA